MPFTSIAEFRTTESPTPAEEALIKACQAGDPCILGNGTLPPEGGPTLERRIRAELLRLLILGGTRNCRLHLSGIRLEGAQITEMLDLRFCKAKGRCVLKNCRFDQKLQIAQAEFAHLSLERSWVPGISAQLMKVEGDIILRGLISIGTINLPGTKIGGRFSCIDAVLEGDPKNDGGKTDALGAQNIETRAGMFLTGLRAKGTVAVNGAKIGGQATFASANLDGGKGNALTAQSIEIGASLSLKELTTKGTINLTGAKIGGQFLCEDADLDGKKGMALNGQSLRVAEAFIFQKQKSVTGEIDLTAAHVGELRDGAFSRGVQFHLNGFSYNRISGSSPLTLATRKDWLARGSRFDDRFHPQPYTQFAKVLREMGHASEARKVAMAAQQEASLHQRALDHAKRKLARAIRHFGEERSLSHRAALSTLSRTCPTSLQDFRIGAVAALASLNAAQPTPPNAPDPLSKATLNFARQDFCNQMAWTAGRARLSIAWSWIKDVLSRRIIGYGHAPQRAIYTMLAAILLLAPFFHIAYLNGVMVPNSDVILTSPSWLWAMIFNSDTPTLVWENGGTAKHYETFYALAYAFDVFVPIVDLGQQSAWSATTVNWLDFSARIATMALEVIGWVVTALAAASITGLVQKNQPD